jgi:anti-sigma regulatory factor (Ser/Thr protein kinase)
MATVERFSTTVRSRDDIGAGILAALAHVERFGLHAQLPPIAAARLSVVVEELVSNTLRHGGGDQPITIEIGLSVRNKLVMLDLTDDGAQFDPTAERKFDGPDAISGGGVGLALIRAWARNSSYARANGRNRVILALSTGEGACGI